MSFFAQLFQSSWSRRRSKLIKTAPQELADFYQSLPDTFELPISSYTIAAVDLETTGLDFNRDEILSIGCVDIKNTRLDLNSSFYDLVKPKQAISEESIVIHGITHDELQHAANIEDQLAQWLKVLSGKILLAHHSVIELSFLNAACRKVYKCDFFMPYLDTLQLERRALERSGSIIKEGDLRITKCRDRHGLPRYPAHHALKDAVSCGELFLAQQNKRFKRATMDEVILTKL